MNMKNAYRALCESERLPLFSNAWWLDATCGEDGWDVALVQKGDEIHAALPFRKRKIMGFDVVSQPALTPALGPWLRCTGAKLANDLSRQKELMTALIDQLPAYDHYQQNWNPAVTNWLPFYWKGFRQTTKYTYVLESLADETTLWGQMRENVRREIRKSSSRFGLSVEVDPPLDDFLALNQLTFSRQFLTRPYSDDYVRRIDDACVRRGCRRILVARDPNGQVHAGVYIVWNESSAYYLMGGADPKLRSSGAMSLCMWEAIKFSKQVTEKFDFEGSMIEPIERFFRAFGAVQKPYFHVVNTPSRVMRLLLAVRGVVN